MSSLRAAVYCRISKDKIGAGLGAERQEADCRALVDRLGWTVAEVYCDNDISAYSGKSRPEYQRMLGDIRAGDIDAVTAWHTDRLHRSPRELEDYIVTCEPRSVPTHCVTAGELDLSTASGRMTARITGAVARHESEHASERIRAQKARSAASGEWTGGRRRFGYVHDGSDIVPAEADAIQDAVRRVLAGESLYSIRNDWQRRIPPMRGKEWTQSVILDMLTNPRHAGYSTHRGEIVGTGTWPAIITADEHAAITSLLKDPRRQTYTGPRSLKWIGSGLYLCARCGSDLRSSTVTTPDGRRMVYSCRNSRHLSISGEPLDEYIIETASTILDRDAADLVPETNREAATELHEQATTLRARLDEVADAFGDGDLSRAQYVRQRDRIETKIADVEEQLTALQSGSVLDGIVTAEQPSAAFRAQPVARQRAIVDALMVVTIEPARFGRLPKGVHFDYSRVRIERRNTIDNT